MSGQPDAEVLQPYRQRIRQAFYKRSGLPQDRVGLANARTAIRAYRKATDDLAGTLELTLEYVEVGTEFTLEFGDIDERFYDSLCSALRDADAILRGDGHSLYPRFRDRLKALAWQARPIGWGYGDFVGDVVGELEHRWSKRE